MKFQEIQNRFGEFFVFHLLSEIDVSAFLQTQSLVQLRKLPKSERNIFLLQQKTFYKFNGKRNEDEILFCINF